MNPLKTFDRGLGKNMPKATNPLGGMDSSNPRHWRGWRLHHHSVGVCCVYVLCVAVSSGHHLSWVDKYHKITSQDAKVDLQQLIVTLALDFNAL